MGTLRGFEMFLQPPSPLPCFDNGVRARFLHAAFAQGGIIASISNNRHATPCTVRGEAANARFAVRMSPELTANAVLWSRSM